MTNDAQLNAVVFDLDGILSNTEDLYELAGMEVLGRRGKTYDEPLRAQMMGRPVADALKIMIDCHALPDPLDRLMAECKEILQGLMETSLGPMPGAVALLNRLRETQMPVAIATSALREYADFVLTRLGLKDRFLFILTAEDIKHGKPNPEIYQLAASRLDIAPRNMMVLEDSGNGCRDAVDAGAFCVAVPNRHTARHDFAGTQFTANTLADQRILEALQLA